MTAAYARGGDPDRVLSLLATWLGHSDAAHTYWYLTATGELMALAAGTARTPAGDRRRRTVMNALATSLQTYFTTFAHSQRDLSSNTIGSYRDTWRMLLKHLTATLGVTADALDFDAVTATNITGFLDHLEHERGNSAKTRNVRLTAIRSVLGRALPDHPEHAATITQVLAIPPKRTTRPVIEFLTPDEVDALLAAPDPTTWTGRRDHALLTMTVQTGLRISEVCSLTIHDIHLGTGPHVTCTGKGRRQRITPLTRRDRGHHDGLPRRTEHPTRHRAVLRPPRTTPVPRRARASPRHDTSPPRRPPAPASPASTSRCTPCDTPQR